MIVTLLISLTWFAALAALVITMRRFAYRHDHDYDYATETLQERSPSLLGDSQESFEQAISQVLAAMPTAAARSSKAAPAEYVRDGSQQDLYVRP
jgi:hypothetical protein